MIRSILFFSGRVQGVGFRYNTNEIAKQFEVTGTVENCDDGRVKIVVEGQRVTIDAFIDAIKIAMSGKIKRLDRFETAASSEFDNFSVRY